MPASRLDIAITDKNPHVREFLCRELAEMGHGTVALCGTTELLHSLDGQTPPQVLVLDPEAFSQRLAEVARKIKAQAGHIAVVLHVFNDTPPQEGFEGALVVEKQPNMGPLKAALAALAAELGRAGGERGGA